MLDVKRFSIEDNLLQAMKAARLHPALKGSEQEFKTAVAASMLAYRGNDKVYRSLKREIELVRAANFAQATGKPVDITDTLLQEGLQVYGLLKIWEASKGGK